jgi:hypothetical protein
MLRDLVPSLLQLDRQEFTPKRSVVRSQYRLPARTAPPEIGRSRLTTRPDNNLERLEEGRGGPPQVVSNVISGRLAAATIRSNDREALRGSTGRPERVVNT